MRFTIASVTVMIIAFAPLTSVLGADAPPRLSAALAVTMGRNAIPGNEWKLAFLSNTGVTDSATSKKFNSPAPALMQSDGTAGQWVLEYFKDTPTPVEHDGQKGQSYPVRRLIVTIGETSELPEASLGVPTKLAPLSDACLAGIDPGRKRALAQNKAAFDVMSAASNVKSSGECSWTFTFYNLKSGGPVNRITVSGDGKTVMQ
jgi:hypothetical protein